MSNKVEKPLRPRDRDAIIQSLRSGVTPRRGLHHIQVGRVSEVDALIKDIDRIVDGGSSFRLIIGDFGSGKSFFLQLIRAIALEKGLVTVHGDLTPDRRLFGSNGSARSMYVELMKNISTRTKQDGNALSSIVERFITEARKEADVENVLVNEIIKSRLNHLSDLVGGYDFAKVVESYWQGFEEDNDQLKEDAIRWLRGEFSTKTEARKALGVRTIVDDSNVYDYLKLMSLFVRQAGYGGLLVNFDEMVNLYKLNHKQSRNSNYEQILRILNDCLQGSAESIGFLMGGTPDFLMCPRRGLYSYEALESRLSENTFAKSIGVVDYTAPTLLLASLLKEEILVLLHNIRHVYASGKQADYLLPDEALESFLHHCHNNVGEAYFKTPRNTIKAFIGLLTVLDQDKDLKWTDLIKSVNVGQEINTDMPGEVHKDAEEDGLASFTL